MRAETVTRTACDRLQLRTRLGLGALGRDRQRKVLSGNRSGSGSGNGGSLGRHFRDVPENWRNFQWTKNHGSNLPITGTDSRTRGFLFVIPFGRFVEDEGSGGTCYRDDTVITDRFH